ncbi:AAA+ ATPase domain [Macleaya cordata]|uniref:DNA-directed DNA polymerase n=1 Tax=Macleaya cordata TaxID=56857 RepID=A0A200RCU8_MACCD|nr:AAA+ ATPase domain [Macleaya cordata]
MTDGRRHSVDLPLSRTLVALRRVRSLRDPSTNYVTKSSVFVDNLTWEPDSGYGFSLGLRNDYQNGGLSNQSPLRCHSFGLKETREEEFPSDPELDCSQREIDYKFNKLARVGKRRSDSLRTKHVEESGFTRSNGGVVYGNKSFDHKHDAHHDRALDLVCIPPSNSHTHLEDVDSYSEPTLGSAQLERDCTVIKRKSGYSKHIKSSRAVGDVGSHVSSPFPSVSDGRLDGSSRSASLFASEEVDIAGPNHRGCGISCCWSTPRFRQSDLPSDVEDHPLLSGEVGEMGLSEPETSCTYVKRENAPYSESPRSLSQKFRPKSFSELVGQHVVARSLLNAISKGRITSFYLFHGPRGTGKTSTSRIFAAALNCLALEEHGPCGLCRECVLFFSGRSRDVKEVDPAKTNRTGRVRSLLKNASRSPVSSRYKVFIIDECQSLQAETWATFLSSLDDLPRHAVFVMITADLDNLPRSVVSRCQRYHFPKIKDVDIVHRLTRICVEEGLDFDEVALDFIAAKSSGSLRDAEMMLDQLSLLGKKITISSAHELIGIVSDDELLELLDLALSSDTSNTVRRARDLMRSRVDPMQLISQLANLIMDILAGRCQTGNSEVGRNFCGRHTSEVDLQKLRHALRILSETEKQLRTSKNQTTWLTVALLQLSSVESFSSDANDSRACLGTTQQRDDGFCSMSLTGESQKHSVSCFCYDNKSRSSEMHPDGKEKLEAIWSKAIGKCQSNTLRSFLRKEGKLSSVCLNQGLAVAEVGFSRPDYVSKAEKSWKLIASSLQLVLGCNVEIRINLVPCSSAVKNGKVNKPSFSFLSCSRRKNSTSEDCTDQSDSSDFSSTRAKKRGKPIKTYSSDPGPQFSPISSHCKEGATTIRNSEGNALSTGTSMSLRSNQDYPESEPQIRAGSSKEENENRECQVLPIQEPENQPSCFSKTLRFQRRLRSSDASRTICLRIQPHNKLDLSIPQKAPFETVFCPNDPYILCSSSNTFSNSSGDEAGKPEKESGKDSKPHCWRAPKIPLRKAWQLRPQQLLPCATAK